MEMQRKKAPSAAALSGKRYTDRLNEAERAAVAPARAGAASMPTPAAPPAVKPPIDNSILGVQNVGGVGVISPPASKVRGSMQRDALGDVGFLRRK